MVATSVSGKKRSLMRRLIALRLSSEVNWPETRTATRSGPAWSTPDGDTAFWACSALRMVRWSMPSAATLRGENSR